MEEEREGEGRRRRKEEKGGGEGREEEAAAASHPISQTADCVDYIGWGLVSRGREGGGGG